MKINWKAVFSNPVFVAIWTAAAGAISPQLYGMVQNGMITWDWSKWQAMLLTGLGAAFVAVLHLYLPSPAPTSTVGAPAQKPLALLLCVVLIFGLFSSGCSGVTVAQDIVNWTPALQSAVATVDTAASLLAPVDAPIFAAATVGFDALSNQLVAQAKAYLANPSLSLLQQLQAQVITFQQSVNVGLLKIAGIKDAASQQHALAALNGVATIINTIFGLIAGIKGNTVAAAATAKTVSLNAVMPYLDRKQAAELLAAHYRESDAQADAQLVAGQQLLAQAGF
jgi:hypothetical protein